MTTTWNPFIIRSFEAAFLPWMRRRISEVFVRGEVHAPADARVILAANHVSWWDGFLLRAVHRASASRAPLFTMMGSQQLHRFPFFRMMGVLGVDSSTSAVRSAIARLKSEPGPFWLSYFPQGRIWPATRRPLGFRPGIELFARALSPCFIVPAGLHLEPLCRPAPSAFIRIGEPRRVDDHGLKSADVELAVSELLDELHDVLCTYGEEAGRVWTTNDLDAGFPGLRCADRSAKHDLQNYET